MSAASEATFARLDQNVANTFLVPAKLINEGSDLSKFLVSQAYHDILAFIALLNRSVFPLKTKDAPVVFRIDAARTSFSPTVTGLRTVLESFDSLIAQAPPDPGPRRFGNISFRKWYGLAEDQVSDLLRQHLPPRVTDFKQADDVSPIAELRAYLMGGFGSAQRLDYGTGHELSFLAFLAGVWKLGGFAEVEPAESLREIVFGLVQPYLVLTRKLILTYNLEPAGTHGVWGLDDHSFIPYILGSAQLGPAIGESDPTPTEGSLPNAPDPGDVVKIDRVQALRTANLYFGAIGFIYDVKKGPFWEHSPTLYDISGVKAGWGKINKGMVKMYNAEVLSKFPVVQHFPFGSLFKWDRSPNAPDRAPDIHSRSQPQQQPRRTNDAQVPGPIDVTSTMQGAQAGLTRAPWAQSAGAALSRPRAGIPSGISGGPPSSTAPTQAPWSRMNAHASRTAEHPVAPTRLATTQEGNGDESLGSTRAPWAS